jgi:hypothetical protein
LSRTGLGVLEAPLAGTFQGGDHRRPFDEQLAGEMQGLTKSRSEPL